MGTLLHRAAWPWTGEPSLQNGGAAGQITWEGGGWHPAPLSSPSLLPPGAGGLSPLAAGPGWGRGSQPRGASGSAGGGYGSASHRAGSSSARGAKRQAGGGTRGPEKQHGLLWFRAHKQMDLRLQSIDSELKCYLASGGELPPPAPLPVHPRRQITHHERQFKAGCGRGFFFFSVFLGGPFFLFSPLPSS